MNNLLTAISRAKSFVHWPSMQTSKIEPDKTKEDFISPNLSRIRHFLTPSAESRARDQSALFAPDITAKASNSPSNSTRRETDPCASQPHGVPLLNLSTEQESLLLFQNGRDMLLKDKMLPNEKRLPAQAYEVLEKSFAANSDNAEVEFWFGLAARVGRMCDGVPDNHLEIAVERLGNVARIWPKSNVVVANQSAALLQYALASAKFHLISEARGLAEQVLARQKSNILANLVLADCDITQGHVAKAIKQLEAVVVDVPQNVALLSFLLSTYGEVIDITNECVYENAANFNFIDVVDRMKYLITQIRRIDPNSFSAKFFEAKLDPEIKSPLPFSERQLYACTWNHGIVSCPLTFIGSNQDYIQFPS